MNDTVDRGDDLTQEQVDAANERRAQNGLAPMTDDDIKAALAVLDGTGETDTDAETEDEEDKEKAASAGESDDDTPAKETGEDESGKGGVPQKRFNEAVEIERARAEQAERRAQELNDKLLQILSGDDKNMQPTPEEHLESLEDKVSDLRGAWSDAVADGDKALARELLGQLRTAEADIRDFTMDLAATRAGSMASERTSYETELVKLETEFPIIDQNAEEYDKGLSVKMTRLVKGLIAGGATRVDALHEAKEIYLTPLKTAKAAQKDVEETLRDQGKETVAKAAKHTPPDTNSGGKAGTDGKATLDPRRMSNKQYAELPEKVRAKLRGDDVLAEDNP